MALQPVRQRQRRPESSVESALGYILNVQVVRQRSTRPYQSMIKGWLIWQSAVNPLAWGTKRRWCRFFLRGLVYLWITSVITRPIPFRIAGTDRNVTMVDVIGRAATDSALAEAVGKTLEAHEDYERDGITFPNGCQICEVEVDVETGETRIDRFSVIDDFGVVINPMTAEGQVMGGVVQGIGQAMLEEIRYDENGQLLSGSFMDYCLPRADDLSNIDVDFYYGQPTEKNPLGAKGSGEAGCCGALPAVVNAVVDALSGHGVKHLEMPLTADSVWRAVNAQAT